MGALAMAFESLLLATNRVALILVGALGPVLVAASLFLEQPFQRGILLVGLLGVLALVCEVTKRRYARLSLLSGIGADVFGSLMFLIPNAGAASPGLGEWIGRAVGAVVLFLLPAVLHLRVGFGVSRQKAG